MTDHWFILSWLKREPRNFTMKKVINQLDFHVLKSDLSFLTERK